VLAEVLAISTAFMWALGSIFARKGLQSSNALTGAFLRVIVSIIFFGILTILFVPFDLFKTEAVVYHGFAGVFGRFVGLIVSLMAIKKVGVAISSTVMSTQSLFSSLAAVLILGEIMTFPIFLGTALIVSGVAVLSFQEEEKRKWLRKTLLLPLIAAFLYAIVAIPTKIGVGLTNAPIFGATIETTTALACLLIFFFITKSKLSINKESLVQLILAGLCGAFGLLCLFYALNHGDVVVVVPLLGTSPFFALFLTHLFLKRIERITLKIIVATIIIVSGSILII